MVPTTILDTYWRFAAERQAMLHRRLTGSPGPWTDDPILCAYRFTNAFRIADRVSQYLIQEVQSRADRSQEPQELFFRTILFKIFNRIETWEALEERLGPMTWASVDLDAIAALLNERIDQGRRNYSAAYIMPSPAFGFERKHANHLALIAAMMEDGLSDRLRQAPSLATVYERLLAYRGLGPFLAFQFAIDLNYCDLIDFSENDFVVAGPGALDGISKCFSHTGRHSPAEIIGWMVDYQESEFTRLGLQFEGLHGRRLHLIDCQNLFCEVAKYTRASHPLLAGISGRTRIKQSYRRSERALPKIALPNGWAVPTGSSTPRPHGAASFVLTSSQTDTTSV